jgi:two-component system chemotaxis response regulator CheY
MSVLIVEDSSIMRKQIAKVVQAAGLEVIETANGAEALGVLRKCGEDIRLVIMDWNMPVMDGFRTLSMIRARKDYEHIPVLMATADGVEEDVIKAIKAGANGYLVKPFTPESLTAKIEELLNL